MVRRYVPKSSTGRRTAAGRARRTARAVELRAEGRSLREIAELLVVDEKTIRNDLKRWALEHPANVVELRTSTADLCPPGGKTPHPKSAPVVPIRRSS